MDNIVFFQTPIAIVAYALTIAFVILSIFIRWNKKWIFAISSIVLFIAFFIIEILKGGQFYEIIVLLLIYAILLLLNSKKEKEHEL